MICPSCQNEQEVGKFCGKCGTALEEKVVVSEDVAEKVEQNTDMDTNDVIVEENTIQSESVNDQEQVSSSQQANQAEYYQATTGGNQEAAQQTVNVDQMKENATKFWTMFKSMLQNPTNAFHVKESQFVFGIITLVLFSFTQMLVVYFMGNSQYRTFSGYTAEYGVPRNLPFFDVGMPIFIIYLIVVVVTAFIVLGMEKLVIKQMSFKLFVAQFGSLLTPLIVLNLVAIILALVSSFVGATILLLLSIIFSLILIPALFIYEKIKYYQASSQHIYIVYVTIIVSFIATFIVSTIILESYFYKMLEILEDFSYF